MESPDESGGPAHLHGLGILPAHPTHRTLPGRSEEPFIKGKEKLGPFH